MISLRLVCFALVTLDQRSSLRARCTSASNCIFSCRFMPILPSRTPSAQWLLIPPYLCFYLLLMFGSCWKQYCRPSTVALTAWTCKLLDLRSFIVYIEQTFSKSVGSVSTHRNLNSGFSVGLILSCIFLFKFCAMIFSFLTRWPYLVFYVFYLVVISFVVYNNVFIWLYIL